MRLSVSVATVVAALGLAAAMPVASQSAVPTASESAADYSDTELQSFAVAVVEIQRITIAYLPRVQTAATPAEKQEVENSAAGEMKRAVETKGFSVSRFNEILAQAQADPQLANRIRRHIKDQ